MYRNCIKRVLDVCISLTALMVLLPLFLILIPVNALAMKGNPFFVQKRPGKIDPKTGKETIISMIKFRSMTNERDQNGELLPDELRLKRYGKFLRATSLDELPSLWNILRGDMSLVGPRPLLVKYLPLYSEEQRRRHTVRPGLTGWAQVNGRNALSWEKRFALDVYYTEHVSFAFDMKIILLTVGKVLKRDGISADNSVTMTEFSGNGE